MSTAREARWTPTEYDVKFKALRAIRQWTDFHDRHGLLASDTDREHDQGPPHVQYHTYARNPVANRYCVHP
jgi:hypothetical protein